jgi:hypothetical protein
MEHPGANYGFGWTPLKKGVYYGWTKLPILQNAANCHQHYDYNIS